MERLSEFGITGRAPGPNTIKRLCSIVEEQVIQILIDSVATNKVENVWRHAAWQHFKNLINGIVPRPLLADIYKRILVDNYQKPARKCLCGKNRRLDWKEKLTNFNGKQFFSICWLFIDEEFQSDLEVSNFVFFDGNFCLELVGYLAETKTALTSLPFSYNWILAMDYQRAFQNHSKLQHLTLHGEINDTFLRVVANHFKLKSLTISNMGSMHKVGRDQFLKFVQSQSDTLEELNWMGTVGPSSPYIIAPECLQMLQHFRCLRRLHIQGRVFQMIQTEEVFARLQHLEIYCATYQHCLSLPKRNFESLSTLNLDLTLIPGDDLRVLREFCFAFPNVDIYLKAAILNYLQVLHLFYSVPNTVRADLKSQSLPFDPNAFKVPANWNQFWCSRTKELHLESDKEQFNHRMLKLIGHACPNITKLSLSFIRILENFDEEDFVSWLTGPLKLLAQLQVFTFRLTASRPSRMSGKSILALLRSYPNLIQIGSLCYFDFTRQEEMELCALAAKYGAQIVNCKKIGSKSWCDGDLHYDHVTS